MVMVIQCLTLKCNNKNMVTEQQKMVALLKMGKPLMKDSMVGASPASSPASSVHDGQPSDDSIAELIRAAKVAEEKKLQANKEAIRRLSIAQPSGSDIAHRSAESAVASLSGMPPNLEGEPLTDPYTEEGSPGGEGSPGVDLSEDTDVEPKPFVEVDEKLGPPSRVSFKGYVALFKKYQKTLTKMFLKNLI